MSKEEILSDLGLTLKLPEGHCVLHGNVKQNYISFMYGPKPPRHFCALCLEEVLVGSAVWMVEVK